MIVPIQIFQIAETCTNEEEIAKWVSAVGADSDKYMTTTADLAGAELLIASAGKRCYMSFEAGLNKNVTRIRENFVEYFDNILKSGHGSVLEHATFTFAIEGVSRVFTAEMNRHRAGWAISEGSMRFIRFDQDIPYWLPRSIAVQPDDDEELRQKKIASQAIFRGVFENCAERYADLLRIWDMDEGDKNFSYKKTVTSCLRRIVPLGVATGGVWTGNVRALRHVMNMRCSSVAEEEICYVFSEICRMLSEKRPMLFGDFEKVDGFWTPKYPKV